MVKFSDIIGWSYINIRDFIQFGFLCMKIEPKKQWDNLALFTYNEILMNS